MSYLISDLKNDLTRKGHGTTIDDLRDPDGLINEAARQLVADVDAPETKRISELPNALFDDVNRTTAPADLKGDKVIDIRPQVNRTLLDNFNQTRSQPFDLYKAIQDNMLSIEQDDGVKYLRIHKVLNKGILLNECEGLTANGTWTAGGLGANLASDTVYYASGSASLSFDVGSGASYVENSTMSAQDLTTHVKQASEFVQLYIPTGFTPSSLTSVNLRWGSSTANYYSQTVTANFDSTAFQTGWNLLQLSWNGLTPTGSPTTTAYNYLRATLNTTAAGTGFKIDSFYSKLPSIYEIVYYSKYLFRSATTGAFQETVLDDSDIVNLDTDGINLLLDKCKELAADDRGGRDAQADAAKAMNDYTMNVKAYNTKYPSEVMPTQTFYYRIRKG